MHPRKTCRHLLMAEQLMATTVNGFGTGRPFIMWGGGPKIRATFFLGLPLTRIMILRELYWGYMGTSLWGKISLQMRVQTLNPSPGSTLAVSRQAQNGCCSYSALLWNGELLKRFRPSGACSAKAALARSVRKQYLL